jgi:YD repeat-containing protein
MTQNGLYGYDAENRLVNLSGAATYTYDADGQLGQAQRALLGGPIFKITTADALAESNASGAARW